MKKSLLLLSVLLLSAAAITSCQDKKNKIWDPNSKISLRAADGVPSGKATNPNHLTAREIVEKTTNIAFYNKDYPGVRLARGFSVNQRDFINNRLLMFGIDIIYDGAYKPLFIEGYDVILDVATKNGVLLDTIAYIPNKTLRDAAAIIKPAFEAGEFDLVYKTFDEAFRFIPITGAEWLELKRQGKN